MAATNNPYSELTSNVHSALDELNADESHYVPQREAEELFYLPDCVHIFFVRADGKVSTFSEPSTLRIFRFKDGGVSTGDAATPSPTNFIQVGGWTHPLMPGQSPVLEAGNGAFMFPDVYGSEQDGAAVGIVIADDSAFNIEGEAQEALAKVLNDLTVLKRQEADALSGNSSADPDIKLGKIGKTLLKSAELVSKGLEKGAEKATTLIEYASEKEKARTEAATEDVKVNPALKNTAKGVKYAAKGTVKVSGFVANRVGILSRKTAEYVAKKVEKPVVGVTGAGGSSDGNGGNKSGTKEKIVDAARGGILAYATVFEGLENSAKVLGSSIKTESVSVVKHKYGEEAGHVYGDSMSAAGNGAMTYMNIQSLGVKGFLKKTAKKTGKNLGKAVIEAHSPAKTNEATQKPKEDNQEKEPQK